MSEEQLKSFLEKVQSDTSLQEKLKSDADAALAIAKEAGFAITTEDIQSMQSERELSYEELESVSGGWGLAGFEKMRALDLLRGTFAIRAMSAHTYYCTCGGNG